MSLTVRRLETADADTARRLGWEAFGVPTDPPTTVAAVDQPGMTWFGAFDESGTLVARTIDREFDACFGGTVVPLSGIAGVTVEAEARGRGALSPLMAATLGHARERGAVVSGLFPTAPGIYRRFGYELVADLLTVEVSTAALTAVRPPTNGVTTRRAHVADVEAVRRVYDRWAVGQNGPLSRRGVSFGGSDEEWLAGATGVTVACDESGAVVGFARWHRGQGYGDAAALQVDDLLADDGDGYRALLRVLGSFSGVASTTRIDTSGDDLARLVLPSVGWRVRSSSPYMIRVLDVVGALTTRRWAPSITVQLDFILEGDVLPGLDGGYRIAVSDGRATVTRSAKTRTARPGTTSDRVLGPRGLALVYAGAQSSANLRTSGLLRGGDPTQDLDWDALFGGRQQHIRDYF